MPRMRRSDQRVIRHVAKQGEYLKRLKSTGEYGYQIVCQCGYISEAYSMSKVTALRLCESKHDAHIGMVKCRTNGTAVEKGAINTSAPWGPKELLVPAPGPDEETSAPDDDLIVPQHYGGAENPLEVIKVMREHLTPEEFIGAMKFNVCKYNLRAKKKGGLVDIKKAAYYQNYLVDFMMEKGMER